MKVILRRTSLGKRGRGSAEKIAVFGIYKRNGYVHAVSVCDTKTYTLYDIIQEKVTPDSIVYTDSYRSYDVLDASQLDNMRTVLYTWVKEAGLVHF